MCPAGRARRPGGISPERSVKSTRDVSGRPGGANEAMLFSAQPRSGQHPPSYGGGSRVPMRTPTQGLRAGDTAPAHDQHRAPPFPGDSDPVLTADFAQTASALMSAGTVTGTLQQVVDLAVATIEGCAFAGIFLIDGGRGNHEGAHRSGRGRDRRPHTATSEGPSSMPSPRRPSSMPTTSRTTAGGRPFGPHARQSGIRSVLAMRLQADTERGTLNLYARYPRAFGVDRPGQGTRPGCRSPGSPSRPRRRGTRGARRRQTSTGRCSSLEADRRGHEDPHGRERINTSSRRSTILHRASQHPQHQAPRGSPESRRYRRRAHRPVRRRHRRSSIRQPPIPGG